MDESLLCLAGINPLVSFGSGYFAMAKRVMSVTCVSSRGRWFSNLRELGPAAGAARPDVPGFFQAQKWDQLSGSGTVVFHG